MAIHLAPILAIVFGLFFCVWVLASVGLWESIQIMAVLLVLVFLFFVFYYIKTELEIVRRRKEKEEQNEEENRKQKVLEEKRQKEKLEKLKKEADIALEQVKRCRVEDLEGLDKETREYLINQWRSQIRTYLKKGWTWEQSVDHVCKGIPPK